MKIEQKMLHSMRLLNVGDHLTIARADKAETADSRQQNHV
jgi:hypothetical protein